MIDPNGPLSEEEEVFVDGVYGKIHTQQLRRRRRLLVVIGVIAVIIFGVGFAIGFIWRV